MLVTRTSNFTGKTNQMELNVTEDQLQRIANRDGLIQNIVPQLNPDEREFLMTGCTPEEWDALFPEDEDE